MRKVIRVLHVLGRLDRGGAETMVMNIYRNIDRTKVQFDFIIHTNDKCDYDDEILELGGKIFHIPRYTGKNHFIYKKAWIEFLDNNTDYKMIHGHIRSTASIYLKIAKKKGLTTIVHAHNTSSRGNLYEQVIKKILQYPIRYQADYLFACSEAAGLWLFGKRVIKKDNYLTLRNAIDVDKFLFNSVIREKLRESLGLEDKFVIGHVGSFTHQKNHKFLLEIFNEIQKLNENSVLLLIGDGELKYEVEKQIDILNIKNKVILMGVIPNVYEYLSVMDIFVFPSFNEGLPVVIVEAQASGLKCILSDTITDEVNITDLVLFDNIKKPAYKWANKICMEKEYKRCNKYDEIASAGYNVSNEIKTIQEFYLR